jgi:hypothetical protein
MKAKSNFVDVLGATLTALILFGMLFGFLWLFGLTGGRYVLTFVSLAAILVGWGWWKLVKRHSPSEQ